MSRKISCILSFSFLCCLAFSCSEQDEVYKDFYNEANTYIYPQRVENLKAVPGYYRVRLSFLKAIDPSVVKAKIMWNSNKDSIIVDMKNPPLTIGDTIYVNIKNLEENSYTFTLRCYDVKGNCSVPMDITTTVRGDTYVGSLSNRSVKSAAAVNGRESLVKWAGKTSGLQYTIFKYKTTEGSYKEIYLPNDVNDLVLYDYDLSNAENYQWKSVFFFPNCLDTLYGKWATSEEPIQYDSDYETEPVDGVNYLRIGNSMSRVTVSNPDPSNPYDYLLTCNVAGSPWIMMEPMADPRQGGVLVFQYQAETPVEKMLFYWIATGQALSTSKRTDLGMLTASTADNWVVFKKNLTADMNKFEWPGDPGDVIRLDLWNMTVGQKLRIRNIHFRPVRYNE